MHSLFILLPVYYFFSYRLLTESCDKLSTPIFAQNFNCMQRDNLVFDLIHKELERQRLGIELIASENFTSLQVMQATGNVMTNKYAEGYPGRRYYGGCEIVDQTEQLAIDRLKQIFKVDYANVQPHSGAQANAAVCLAVLQPGDDILGLDLSMGGHLTHGSPVNFSGKLYKPHFYGVVRETGLVDYDMLETKAKEIKPKLIICGASAYSRDWDYVRIRKAADEVGAFIMADIAHPAGLIAKNLLNDPFEHCHIVTSTTHKTLRGPRGGIIMMRKDFENPFDLKDVAFGEILTDEFTVYAQQIINNAQAMAKAFVEKDYNIISCGTDNHLLLIDLRNKNISGKKAEQVLGLADITVNKNMVPFDDKSAFVTSGVRIGIPAITTRGMKEEHMQFVVNAIDKVLMNTDDKNLIEGVRKDVNEFMQQFPLYPELN